MRYFLIIVIIALIHSSCKTMKNETDNNVDVREILLVLDMHGSGGNITHIYKFDKNGLLNYKVGSVNDFVFNESFSYEKLIKAQFILFCKERNKDLSMKKIKEIQNLVKNNSDLFFEGLSNDRDPSEFYLFIDGNKIAFGDLSRYVENDNFPIKLKELIKIITNQFHRKIC